jgi:hypothetical protein
MIDYNWKKTDPRKTINKHADIVILRPSLTGQLEAGIGYVDNKETFCIFTSFENHSVVSECETWDEAWMWTWAPDKV